MRKITRIASCSLSTAIVIALTACGGGGGGGGGLVRSPAPSAPPPAAPPPPPPLPPPPPPASTCPSQPTSDCIVTRPGDAGNVYWRNDVTSNFALIKQGVHYLDIVSGDYRFAGGTQIEEGGIFIGEGVAFISNMDVHPNAWLSVVGSVVGNTSTRSSSSGNGQLSLFGTLRGDVFNAGTTSVSIYSPGYSGALRPSNRIEGDFHQTGTGTLGFSLPYLDYFTPLTITGRADLAGTLLLSRYVDWDLGPIPLPVSPLTLHLINAGGGVFGTFDRWISPGLFMTGDVRYGSNDVWFDLTRVSVQAAMAGSNASAATLASAANLDRALTVADRFAVTPASSLNGAQRAFLQSAGRLLWLADAAQAQRSMDSLAGSVHVDALQRAAHDNAMATTMAQRLLTLQPGHVAGSWSRLGAEATVAGFDQWLGPRMLFGASTSEGSTTFGGQSRDRAAQAALYLRWFGDGGWYAGGSAGFARHALTVDRPIDLGPGGRWNAHSQRGVSVTSLESEAGRRFTLGGGVLSPYASLGADLIRSERALEQGTTGFELALQANTQARLSAGLGLRYGKRWQIGEDGWLQLDADARMEHGLADAGSPLQAAFIGVPDVGFALPGSVGNTSRWMSLGLRGGTASGWGWTLSQAGSFGGQRPERHWLLALQRSF